MCTFCMQKSLYQNRNKTQKHTLILYAAAVLFMILPFIVYLFFEN